VHQKSMGFNTNGTDSPRIHKATTPTTSRAILYHAWHYGRVGQDGRAMLLDTVTFHTDGWPRLDANHGEPTFTVQTPPA
jgi:hypothetical protein